MVQPLQTTTGLDVGAAECGKLVLQWLCAYEGLTGELLTRALEYFPDAAQFKAADGRWPLQIVRQNKNASAEALAIVSQAYPAAAEETAAEETAAAEEAAEAKLAAASLSTLCSTEGVTADQLALAINKDPSAAAKKDTLGSLPVHSLCGNQTMSAETLAVVLQANPAAATEKASMLAQLNVAS